MKTIKQTFSPAVFTTLVALFVGYVLGCTGEQREKKSEARAAQDKSAAAKDQNEKPDAKGGRNKVEPAAVEPKHFHAKGKPPSKFTIEGTKRADEKRTQLIS